MQTHFACLRGKHVSFYTDKIANIKKFFEYIIVHRFVLIWTNFVAIHVDLQVASSVCKYGKRSLSHDAFCHQAPRYAYALKALCAFCVAGGEVFSMVGNYIFRSGIRVDT